MEERRKKTREGMLEGERWDEEMKEQMELREDKTKRDSQTLKCQTHQTLTHRSSLISSRAVSV